MDRQNCSPERTVLTLKGLLTARVYGSSFMLKAKSKVPRNGDTLMGGSTIVHCAYAAHCSAAYHSRVANCSSAKVLLLYASTTKVVPSGTLHYSTLLSFFHVLLYAVVMFIVVFQLAIYAHHRTIICCSACMKSFYFIIIYFYHCSLL